MINRTRPLRRQPVVVVMPDMRTLTSEELIAIVRRSSSDPYRWTLRERLAWRELSFRN